MTHHFSAMNAPLSAGTESRAVPLLEAFTGDISRTRPSLFYTIGLAVVAFAMVLLPAIYIALIALTSWGVLYHLTHNTWILSEKSGGSLMRLILYFGPAVAGGILVFFML